MSEEFVFRGIACIIGPCRFSKLYREVSRELTIRGWIVLDAGSYVYDETDPSVISRLNAAHASVGKLHHLKIGLSNLIVLVSGRYNGQEQYIGENTRSDLDVAHRLHKPSFIGTSSTENSTKLKEQYHQSEHDRAAKETRDLGV